MAKRQGYQGIIRYKSAPVKFLDVPTVSGLERTPLPTTALHDGKAPFRSYIIGLYGDIEIAGRIALDTADAACTGAITDMNSGTTGSALALLAATGTTPLLTGANAGCIRCIPVVDQEGIQVLDITLRYCGSITGTLCASAT